MGNVATPHETHFENEKQNIHGTRHIWKQETNYDNYDQNLSGACDSWPNQTKEEICENSCISSSDYDQVFIIVFQLIFIQIHTFKEIFK